jgi:hypothetical protein
MPGIPRTAASATEPSRVLGSELQAPEADCFMGHFDPTLEHHFLNVAKAEAEAKVEPNAVGNDLAREAITTVVGGR